MLKKLLATPVKRVLCTPSPAASTSFLAPVRAKKINLWASEKMLYSSRAPSNQQQNGRRPAQQEPQKPVQAIIPEDIKKPLNETKSNANTQAVDIEYESAGSDLVIEIDSMETLQNTLRENRQIAMVLDCYADWCEPCKKLTPMLEQLVQEFGGAIKVLRLNVDNVPDVAQQFPIEALPTLFGIIHGSKLASPVQGLPSEEGLRKWMTAIMNVHFEGVPEEQRKQILQQQQQASDSKQFKGKPEDLLILARDLIAKQQHLKASAVYTQLLQDESAKDFHAKAYGGLLMCCLGQGEFGKADTVFEQLKEAFPAVMTVDPDVRQAVGLYDFTKKFNNIVGDKPTKQVMEELASQLQQDPNNHQARLNHAVALFMMAQHQPALDECFTVIKKAGKAWNEGAARKIAVEMLDILGPTNPISLAGRKRLSSLLF